MKSEKVKVKSAPNRKKLGEPGGPSVPALISGFCSMKRLGVFLLPHAWDSSPFQVTSQHFVSLSPKKFAGSHLYTWMERGTVRAKCFAQEYNVGAPAWARTLDLLVPSATH